MLLNSFLLIIVIVIIIFISDSWVKSQLVAHPKPVPTPPIDQLNASNYVYRPADEMTSSAESSDSTFTIGFCKIAINRLCPDPTIRFYLYSAQYPEEPEFIRIGSHPNASNLTKSAFDANMPTKLIIHGFNSDINLAALVEIRKEYLANGNNASINVFMMDWSEWCRGPICYPAAVWNIRHVGLCASQFVERLRDVGAHDIHVIGFSLGAHVPNFMAIALRPYLVSRITGLDPAMPGFVTANINDRLDKSDAHFVDVIHTNGLMQGLLQQTGHIDYYVNGGVFQPGCWAEERSFACNHHRAPLYFAESIRSKVGFWGWPCPSYMTYLVGGCLPKEPQLLMGDRAPSSGRGVHLVLTNSVAPYAVGKFTKPAIDIYYVRGQHERKKLMTRFRKDVLRTWSVDTLIDQFFQGSPDAQLAEAFFGGSSHSEAKDSTTPGNWDFISAPLVDLI